MADQPPSKAPLSTENAEHGHADLDPGKTRVSAPQLAGEIEPGAAQRTLSQLGDYVLLKAIGTGAMGTVYKARDVHTQRDVALKVLYRHVAENPRLVERFHREALISGSLDHPNIVCGYGVGEEHGWHYFAMEFVEGESLQRWLNRVGKISLPDTLHIGLRCAHALQYAHGQALIHRDVKPDNILLTDKGEVKLADLGMAKDLEEDMSLTQTGHAVGTPWYMPLEQAKNAKDTDGRCDIYALGCVIYACLTGKPPFTGRTIVEVIQAKETGTFPPARQSNLEVPERVDLIIAKMTARLPKHRYQNCQELIQDLESLGLAGATLGSRHTVHVQPSSDEGPLPTGSPKSTGDRRLTAVDNRKTKTDEDIWYLRYKLNDGTPTQERLSTAEVLTLADTPDFDPTAKASRHPKEGFRGLATFKEFERVVSRVTRSHADKQTFRQRKLFEQIVEQQNQMEESAKEPTTTFYHWLGIFWRCAAVIAALVVLYFVGSWFVSGLQGVFW